MPGAAPPAEESRAARAARSRRPRIVVPLASLAVALATVVPSAIVVDGLSQGARLVHLRRVRVTPADARSAFAEFPGLENVTLQTSDALRLRGWFWPGTKRAVIIFVHGGAANRTQLLPEARALARRGYGFLVYDSRAAGDSDGDVVTWGDREQRDVAAALDFVSARPDVDSRRIAVLGFSIGGSTVALETARDPRASAIVLYATWTSLEDEMKRNNGAHGVLSWGPILYEMRRAGVEVAAVRPIDAVGRRGPRPLLMIAGAEDDDTPVDVMRRVFEAASLPKELWIEAGANHGGYYAAAPLAYEARLVAFLEQAWSGAVRP